MKVKIVQLHGIPNHDGLYGLVADETGELLYTHFCSNIHFAKGDLYDNKPERQEELIQRFGTVEVDWRKESEQSEQCS